MFQKLANPSSVSPNGRLPNHHATSPFLHHLRRLSHPPWGTPIVMLIKNTARMANMLKNYKVDNAPRIKKIRMPVFEMFFDFIKLHE
jgi:hypothetical protein